MVRASSAARRRDIDSRSRARGSGARSRCGWSGWASRGLGNACRGCYLVGMQHLPWLVVHGALAFRLALAGATLLGLALAWLTPRARALSRARTARTALGDPAAGFEEGATVTVIGTLEATGAAASP